MLERTQCERILAIMANHSVTDKLKAIEEAQVMFKQAFKPGMSDAEFAYSAMVVEQQYNYIREILQVKQIRIKADLSDNMLHKHEKTVKKSAAAKKVNKYAFDMTNLSKAFGQFIQKGDENAKSTTIADSNPSKAGT